MRYYSSVAGEYILVSAVAAADTAIELDATVGLPSATPVTLLLDYGQNSEEVVTVNTVAGNTLTVDRGQDGTSKVSHSAGAAVRHGITARDLRESREHEEATSAHGAVGELASTNASQVLKNKTLDGASNTFTNLPKSSIPSDTVFTAATQTLTNKTLTSPTLTGATLTGATLSSPTVTGTQTGGQVAASNLTGSTTDTVAPYSYRVASDTRSVANQTWTPIAPLVTTAAQSGEHGAWSYGSGVFTTPMTGRYQVEVAVGFEVNPTGNRVLRVTRGDGIEVMRGQSPALAGYNTIVAASKSMVLQSNLTLTFECWQSSGGTISTVGGDSYTYVSISYLGAA